MIRVKFREWYRNKWYGFLGSGMTSHWRGLLNVLSYFTDGVIFRVWWCVP